MQLRWVLLTALVVAGVLVGIVLTDREPQRSEYCTADVGATHAQIDNEQARWTTLMAAVAQRRGLPPRATTIAIATAFQESRIHNIDFGDRDSIGLFQQRPSQGWGTREQILDPAYAINKFYDGLAKVNGYEAMIITDAAQEVQRSGFPGAYAQHEDYARALASALRGYSPAAFNCVINPTGAGRVGDVRSDLREAYGDIVVNTGDGVVDLPLNAAEPEVDARGWSFAHYAVGNAARLEIASVSFDGLRWTAADSPDGWVADSSAKPGRVVIRLH